MSQAGGRKEDAHHRADGSYAEQDGDGAVFSNFWAKNRLLLKRIHGIAAVDPEFGKAIYARNQRRKMGLRG